MNDTLHNWAQDILAIIHEVDDTVIGGIGGMGSQDGHYVSKEVAVSIRQKFADDSDYDIEENIDPDWKEYYIRDLRNTGDYSYGFEMHSDEFVLEEVKLNFYDSNY